MVSRLDSTNFKKTRVGPSASNLPAPPARRKSICPPRMAQPTIQARLDLVPPDPSLGIGVSHPAHAPFEIAHVLLSQNPVRGPQSITDELYPAMHGAHESLRFVQP